MVAALLLAQGALTHGEHERQDRHQHQLQPQRPVQLRTEGHREQQAAEDQREVQRAQPVNTRRRLATGFRHIAAAQSQHQQADRHIDKKGVAPAQPGDVRRYQPAAAHLSDNKGDPADAAIQADGPGVGGAFEGHVQSGEDLRHNQRRPGALQGAGRQQGADAVRHPAQQGSDAKEGDAPHKQAPAAIVIAKLTAHRQADGKGDAVKRDDKLQLRGAGRQGVGDGVQRHIGDRGINKRQHLAAQQQQQTGAAG